MRSSKCGIVPVIVCLGVWIPLQAAPITYYCEQQYDLPIPATPGATVGWMDDAILNVPGHLAIADLDVTITLTHTSDFDLRIYLQSPAGTRVVLNAYDAFTAYFAGANYDHTIFDDEATVSIQSGTAPFTGRFRPLSALSAFDGQDAYGPWRLQIYDAFYANTGELQTFGLFITVPTVPAPAALTLALIGWGLVLRLRHRRQANA